MANVKVRHELTISRGVDKQSAYMLVRASSRPSLTSPGAFDVEVSPSAWTTLKKAKHEACHMVGRQRLSWTARDLPDATEWRAEYIEIVKTE